MTVYWFVAGLTIGGLFVGVILPYLIERSRTRRPYGTKPTDPIEGSGPLPPTPPGDGPVTPI